MYFVHPQIKFNISNLAKLFFCFLKKPDSHIREKLKEMFPEKENYLTDMGRSAFRLIVEELQLQNSQMMIPSYICDIFFPLFLEYNILPVFLDIEKETFNIDPAQIEEKMNPEVKSMVVCHTYGLPANLDKILAVAKKYNLKVIEDCAHSLGVQYKGNYTGNFGDAALFSLYKLFPTLRGGMAIIKNPKPEIRPARRSLGAGGNPKDLPPTHFSLRDFVSLLNCFPCFSFLFKKYAGKIAPKYIRGEKIPRPSKINRVSLNIFAWQLSPVRNKVPPTSTLPRERISNGVKNLATTLNQRKELGSFFQQELKKMGFEVQNPTGSNGSDRSGLNHFTFLSALVPKNIPRDKFVVSLRKKGIFATRIWHTPIILNKEVQKKYNINLSQFPNTVEVARRIVNFPLQNFYTNKDIKKMIQKIKESI